MVTRIQFHLLIAICGFMGAASFATTWEWASGTSAPTFHLLPFIGLSVLHGVIAAWEAYEGQRAASSDITHFFINRSKVDVDEMIVNLNMREPHQRLTTVIHPSGIRLWAQKHEEGLSK